MSQDPHRNLADSVKRNGTLLQRLADLERKVQALEANQGIIQVTTGGAPTTTPREGTPALDPAPRLWLRINGGWHYTTLT